MLASSRHRFNVTDYYRMAEIGILHPDARVELLNGQVVDCCRISPLHAGTTHQLAESCFHQPGQRWIVSVHNPVRLDEYSEVQPDVMLIRYRADYYKTRHPVPGEVHLVIEVADASLAYDREEKLPAYGRAGIAEVWIVNLNELTVEVYREPHFNGYGSKIILQPGGQARPLAFPDAAVDVAELLKH